MPVRGGVKFKAHLRQQNKFPEVTKVQVGILGGKYPDGISIGQVAAAHEFGLGVPERPFMRPGVREAMNDVIRLLRQRTDAGRLTANRAVAEELGRIVATAIRQRILFVSEPPLAAATRRGRGGGTPLVDTRRLLGSVDWQSE